MSPEKLPRLEIENVLRADAAEIIAAREKAQIIHRGRDIDAAGDEVEVATRRVIRRKLPTSYYVGHGHIVDSELTQSPQLDVVIADNSDAPILFVTENGTEYFPYEAVYGIGEVKSTYYKSKNYVETFVETLARIKAELNREPTPPTYMGSGINMDTPVLRMSVNAPYRNPLFSFMVFAKANDFEAADLIDLYTSRPASELPNILCFLDKGVVLHITFAEREGQQHVTLNPVPEWQEESESGDRGRWIFNQLDPAASFGFLYLMILEHLSRCRLYSPDLMTYLTNFFRASVGHYEMFPEKPAPPDTP